MASDIPKRKFEETFATESVEIEEEDSVSILDTVIPRLQKLDKEVNGKYGIEHRLEELEAQLADITNDFCEMKGENKELKDEQKLMKALLIKKDKEISDLKAAQVDQQARSMRNNILIHNVPESKGENCENKLKQLLKKETSLPHKTVDDMKVERAHRVGQPHIGEGGRPRLIVAKLSFYKDRDTILEAWRQHKAATTMQSAKGTKQLGIHNITTQLPQQTLEQRRLNLQMVENMKISSGEDNITCKLVGDKAYVNNELIRPKILLPSVEQLLNIDGDEKTKASKLSRAESTMMSERGSTFVAEAYKASSMQEVRMAYRRVVSTPEKTKASHNILAYKAQGETGWIDDGDHGVGRFLCTWITKQKLNNIAIIVTRQYGGQHLSTRRFELSRQVASEAQRLLTVTASE